MQNADRETKASVLDPIDRVSEVIFGLLMAMSFVGSLSVASAGREELRTLLIAALGCNLAWGITDAVMHLVASTTERRRHYNLLQRLHDGPDAASGQRLIAASLPPSLAASIGAEGLERLRQHLLESPASSKGPRLRMEDYKAALGIFILVVLATFPVVLPFLFVSTTELAVRLSQAISLVMLYIAGAALAHYSGGRAWLGGLTMAGTGAALIAAIIALGG